METARRSAEKHQAEDRRIDLVIRELRRYQVLVAALQETKWFGNKVYHVDDMLCLQLADQRHLQGSQNREGRV